MRGVWGRECSRLLGSCMDGAWGVWHAKVPGAWAMLALGGSVGLSASMGLGSAGPEVQRIPRPVVSGLLRA